jgi:hypothetical protein
MRILILARRSGFPFYGFAYGAAFERLGVQLNYLPEESSDSVSVQSLVERCPERPDLIYLPDWSRSPLPPGIAAIDIPTVNENADTYAYTQHRIRWSMLFDYTLLFHPAYDERFRAAGHPRPLYMPLAVDRNIIEGPKFERTIELAAVGRIDSYLYVTRKRLLTMLDGHFQMNDWRKLYPPKEMGSIFRMSKIVINIPREDYLQEANMRTFEVMGSGALLLTRLPSELSDMGFVEGVHFIGYRKEEELVPLVRRYLADDTARTEIAERAHDIVWREHTYDSRVATLLSQVKADNGQLLAPARKWTEDRVGLTYIDHYCSQQYLGRAHQVWRSVALKSPLTAGIGASFILKAYARRVRNSKLFNPNPVPPIPEASDQESA